MKLATTIMFLTLACGAEAPGFRAPEVVEVPEEPVVEAPQSCAQDCPAAAPEEVAMSMKAPPKVMYVDPLRTSGDAQTDDDLLELTLRVIERVHLRTDAVIEIRAGGIPIRINDRDTAQARAVSDKWCYGGDCTADHAHISIRSDTLARMYFDNFADNALAHEFSHVLSGWGQCSTMDTDGHLTPGHIISNGNEHYGTMSWTDEDTTFACSCGACP